MRRNQQCWNKFLMANNKQHKIGLVLVINFYFYFPSYLFFSKERNYTHGICHTKLS